MIATRIEQPARKCLVAICHNGPVMFTETVWSLLGVGWGNRVDTAKQMHGFTSIDAYGESSFPRVDSMRDHVATVAIREGYTHILFLDADMKWPQDLLCKMLAFHDKGIVQGSYYQKGTPFRPVAMKDGHVPEGTSTTFYHCDVDYRDDGQADRDGLRDVEIVGMGCTLVPVSVFQAIGPRPWFEYENDDEGWPRVSEDVTFCRKAKAAGYRVAWMPKIECKHGSVRYVGERDFLGATVGSMADMLTLASMAAQ